MAKITFCLNKYHDLTFMSKNLGSGLGLYLKSIKVLEVFSIYSIYLKKLNEFVSFFKINRRKLK